MAKDWMDDLSEQQVKVAHMVADEAERQGIPVPLALAAAMQESSFQQLKKSGTGPQGVMMVGKAASKDLGIDPRKVQENIRGGITYLKQQLDKNNWNYDKALVAYHDGPNSPYVLGTGPMSPAAENHIAKVKEYGGYEGYEAPTQATEEPVDTSVAPVEQINYVEPSAADAESSGTDLLAAGIGAAAGALKSPHKPQSMHSIDQQLEEHRLATKPIVAANKALEDQYKADVKAREEAIALRKASLDAAEKTAGSGVRNYTQKEFGGNIPQTINPLDMGEAQSMGQQAVKAERRVQQMMPGVQFDPTRGLLLPPSVQPLPKVAPPPIDAGLPPVRAPKLAPIPEPQIYKGSMLGRAGTSVGGAAALGLGANAVDRALSGDTTGAVLGGLAAAGGAGTQARNPRTAAISGATGLGALGAQMLYDKFKPKEKSVLEGFAGGGLTSLPHYAGAKDSFVKKVAATVMRPQRMAYPEIYQDPRMLVSEAAARVAPEDPLLKRLFNVNREDLWDISQQGTRKGNITERPFNAAANAKGAAHAGEVMNPRNVKRLQNIIGEAQQRPELYKGMASWYTMDPLYQRFVDLYGPEEAINAYKKFNTLTGMASPGSEVMTELNRGTAANYLSNQGRFEDFKKFGGQAGRGPEDMNAVLGHPYHSTAQSGPMEKYLSSGLLDMGSAKVPSYIHASGVPETGFQTSWPVGDAHWSRLVGLPDVRGARTVKGKEAVPNASASVPEMTTLGPWWKDEVAAPMGLEAVPAQAVVWGAGSGATGVTSPIGAGKLELLAKQIGSAAQRMGVTPETARDMIIQGKAYAGGLPTK